MEHCGFANYGKTGKIDDEFIGDFDYWTKTIYRRWSLFIDLDEFSSICWTALLARLPDFDPSIATIQTYCISTINNEAWRRYMKNKSIRPECDADDAVVQQHLYSTDVSMKDNFTTYVYQAQRLGVYVPMDDLLIAYKLQEKNVFTACLNWWIVQQMDKGEY